MQFSLSSFKNLIKFLRANEIQINKQKDFQKEKDINELKGLEIRETCNNKLISKTTFVMIINFCYTPWMKS